MKRLLLLLGLVSGLWSLASAAESRPNILWITAEDMSPTLGCYGDAFATTPNIDRLAKESVRYTRAFATAPVCSPSRSCLITGCYATSLGTMQMRSAFPIPDEMTGFPSVLRKELGYFTTNNVKTDYNTANWEKIIAASWDESSDTAHWRKNPDKKRPFFSIFNLMTSHQSRTMVWPYEKFQAEVQSQLPKDKIHDPAKVPLPPYYVDTPVVRKTVARFYDCVSVMDQQVGAILKELEEDGLAEDTIVFFYSDHGSGMPRHKRALLDSGMHVPLLIRFPEKWKHLAPGKRGESTDRLVSFVDFGPSVLSLAGAEIPDYMQGIPFLGAKAGKPRDFAYGHRDRVDEVIDLSRSVRTKRYLYIRNYMPHYGYNQPTAWPDLGEIRHEFYRLTSAGSMTKPQWHFAAPHRPIEELYDCEQDPQNLENLAGRNRSPEHSRVLEELRREHLRHAVESRDLGFIPESELWKRTAGTTPLEAASEKKLSVEKPLLIAKQVPGSSHFGGKRPMDAIIPLLGAGSAAERYWALMILLASSQDLDDKLKAGVVPLLEDESSAVRIEAANLLTLRGDPDRGLPVLTAALELEDLTSVLHAARTVEMLGEDARSAVPAMEKVLARAYKIRPPDLSPVVVASGEQDLAMFVAFSANAFLVKMKEKENAGAWIDLFDGETLAGWKALAEGEVKVVDGEIQILAKGKNLWLLHEKEFGDFELTAEVKMPDDAYNSGIGFRCAEAKGKPKGYQCEVAGKESGMLYAIGSGWVWPKGDEEKKKFAEMAGDAFKPKEWNTLRIVAEGEQLKIWVNGTLTADVADQRFAKGRVALQHHGKGGLHRFRKVRVKEL